jgi:saccharopine dehydrogenase (NAD+, L-lysine-forming)
VQLAKDVGIPESNIVEWDMAETKRGESIGVYQPFLLDQNLTFAGGPFREISHDADIFVNCIYLSAKIPRKFLA